MNPIHYPFATFLQRLCVVLVLVAASASVFASDKPNITPPSSAENTDQIVEAIPKLHKGSLIDVAKHMHTMEYRNTHGRVFVAWVNPFSGRAACYVYAYRYNPLKKQWTRYLNKLIDGTVHPIVETAFDRVRIKNQKNDIVYEQRSYHSESEVADALRAGKLGPALAKAARESGTVHVAELELSDIPYRVFHATMGPTGTTILDDRGKLRTLCTATNGGLAEAIAMQEKNDRELLTYRYKVNAKESKAGEYELEE